MRWLILIGLMAMAGCAAEHKAPAGQDLGRETFVNYCAGCHGKSARGDGPLAAELPVAPADLTMLAVSNDGVFPRSRVMAKIYGYPGQYHAHVMPEFGPILAGRQVMWEDETGAMIKTPQALLDLTDYLMSLQADQG